MMIDKLLEMANSTSTVGSAGRFKSDYCIDTVKAGSALVDVPYLVVQVDAAFTASGGAQNATFTLETYTTKDFDSARTVLWSSGALPKATLVAGYTMVVPMPVSNLLEYITVICTTDTHDSTSGSTFSAFIVREPDFRAAKA